MANAIRPRRIVIAASVLSIALAAPIVTVPDVPFLPVAQAVTAGDFSQRYTTDNFWNANEAVVQGLQLNAGDRVEATTNTIFNWRFRNDGGQLVLIRPQSAAAFKTGNVDIAVKVTPAGERAFNTTLRVNVVDERPREAWESAFDQRYDVDFEKSTADKPTGLVLPSGVTVSKRGVSPTGWNVKMDGSEVRVTPNSTFADGSTIDIPITVRSGGNSFDSVLKITARNPKGLKDGFLGGLGNSLGNLLNNNGKGIFEGLISGSITNSGNNNGSPSIVVTNNANPSVVITNNANPNVEVKDNLSNNGNPVITNNANPSVQVDIRDNGSNNGSGNTVQITGNANPIITGNANPNVEIKDNMSNNGNPIITNNANPIITGNANNNGSNNNVSGNGVIEPSAAVITGNANPNVIITGNANPSNNGNNNGSNNSAMITGNANPNITGNGVMHPGAVDVKVTDIFGRNRGNGAAGTGLGTGGVGGFSDPRCIASLAALGIPLAAMIPVALAQTLNLPALDNSAAIAAGAFNDILGQLGVSPSQVTAVGGGIVGVALAATIAAIAFTCTPKIAPVEVPVVATPVVPTI